VSCVLLLLLLQRLATDDQVRKIVKEEGRTARNLVTWNVPLEDEGDLLSVCVCSVVTVNSIVTASYRQTL